MVVRPLASEDSLRGAITRRLYAYWASKRGDRPYPAWPAIELMELWDIASSLMVKDVLDGGADFRNRFWGSRLTGATGIEGTGKTTSEIYGTTSETNFVNYRRVVETGEPILSYRRLSFIDRREHVTREALHLPLGPQGGPVTHIISAFDYDCDLAEMLGDD